MRRALVLPLVALGTIPLPSLAEYHEELWDEPVAANNNWSYYDEDATYDSHMTTDIEPQMNGVNPSAYIRIPFTVTESLAIERLALWVKYDDGYVAYLNGVKVAERNAPVDPSWDSTATDQHSDGAAVFFEGADITAAGDTIEVGENILAVHGLNLSLTSSDFLIAVELDARVR